MTLADSLIAQALACGAHAAATLPVSALHFDRVFRDICQSNACGLYNRCYMCPPDVGAIEALMTEARGYDQALIYNTLGTLEDSFDFEGMQQAGSRHNDCAQRLAEAIGRGPDRLHLSAGGCRVCEPCFKQFSQPCPHPGLAMSSLEAYGLDVYKAAQAAGLKYNNGPNTVTYFGLVLYRHA